MFGAEHRIIDGYGCDKCRNGPTDGACCPEPIRYWRHTTDAGRTLLFSSWPTSQTPGLCERHDLATDGRSCWVCLFGPLTAEELPSGKRVRLPEAEPVPPRVRYITEHRILSAKGCPDCRNRPTYGKCCDEPIRYTCSRVRVGDQYQDIDFSPWPTATLTPYWCDLHRIASSHPECLSCTQDVAPENTPAQLERAALMTRLRAECAQETTGGAAATDPAPPRRSTTRRRNGMHSTNDGILVTQPELRALLAFSSREQTDRDKYGVQFAATTRACFARSSNGRICVQAHGEAGDLTGEWFVHKDFLSAAYKLMTAKRAVLLEFSGASLHHASIRENDQEIERLEWQGEGAAIAQAAFPKVQKHIKLPKKSRTPAHCVAVCAEYLPVLDTIAKAAGVDFVDLYPPADPQSQLVFQAGGDESTSWTGAIWPTPSKSSTSKGDDSEPDAEAAE